MLSFLRIVQALSATVIVTRLTTPLAYLSIIAALITIVCLSYDAGLRCTTRIRDQMAIISWDQIHINNNTAVRTTVYSLRPGQSLCKEHVHQRPSFSFCFGKLQYFT
jgi:hypothetical protein